VKAPKPRNERKLESVPLATPQFPKPSLVQRKDYEVISGRMWDAGIRCWKDFCVEVVPVRIRPAPPSKRRIWYPIDDVVLKPEEHLKKLVAAIEGEIAPMQSKPRQKSKPKPRRKTKAQETERKRFERAMKAMMEEVSAADVADKLNKLLDQRLR
jgi:hypothetical protein